MDGVRHAGKGPSIRCIPSPIRGKANLRRIQQFGTRFSAPLKSAVYPWRGAHGPGSAVFGLNLLHLRNVFWDATMSVEIWLICPEHREVLYRDRMSTTGHN